MRIIRFETPTAASVTTDWSTIWTFAHERATAGYLNLEIENVGAVDFTDLQLEVRDHASGEWYAYLTGADWADTGIPYRMLATTDLKTLAGTTIGHAQVYLNASQAVRLRAKVGASTTTAKVRGTFAADGKD